MDAAQNSEIFKAFNAEPLCNVLRKTITPKSRLKIAASDFSLFAYEALKSSLSEIEELRFLFTSPTFIAEKTKKSKREFYIPRMAHENNLYGTKYEIRLRNELTQRAIAKECAEWISRKVKFKSCRTEASSPCFLNVASEEGQYVYYPFNEFTTVGLGCEQSDSSNIGPTFPIPYSSFKQYIDVFDRLWSDRKDCQDVTKQVIERLMSVYAENSPEFIYFIALCNIFKEFLDDISEDVLPNEATGFKNSRVWQMLFNFQRDAALAIINKLEKFNGCILADSVGLGKTFTALAVVKYYESRNKNVLVLCPKKLANNWTTYLGNYVNNPLYEDRFSYHVLNHTDLGRTSGYSNGIDLTRLRWENYDLVVIDESHNFRNGGRLDYEESGKRNRYSRLMDMMRNGVKTKALMLSATPVNTRFNDLKNQLQLAYEGDASIIDSKLKTKSSIDEIFKNAQRAFNRWGNLDPESRTTDNLLKSFDDDFFELLDSVTIARSRKQIERFYDTTSIGRFPERLKPVSRRPHLTKLKGATNYNEIFNLLISMNLDIYRPTHYILESRKAKYAELYGDNKVNKGFTQENREIGLRRLMAINLMKRMESSVDSFRNTLARIQKLISGAVEKLNDYESFLRACRSGAVRGGETLDISDFSDVEDDLDDLDGEEPLGIGKKIQIELCDMDRESWRKALVEDLTILSELIEKSSVVTPEYDNKLQELFNVLSDKMRNPINEGNRKVIIFTAFADTALYLYEQVSQFMLKRFGLHTAVITGSVSGRTTAKIKNGDMNTILTCFSPKSKDRDQFVDIPRVDIDVLIATDCISEGQNLQDCDYLINYDIHWNPVRIIQRFGRIDRIGSQNQVVQLVNFWPDITLDEYIKLKKRVESRMKLVDAIATGDDNPLSDEEKHDMDFRMAQLKRLQEEVVDIEEMKGISIVDLGLNEFRLDLLDFVKAHPELETSPLGLHSVAPASDEFPPGVIFILKNRNESNHNNRNRLHPFYMVYVNENGETECNYLQPKRLLDIMRRFCRGQDKPIEALYRQFNQETCDGRSMENVSRLLKNAIESIIQVKGECDNDSLFRPGGTTAKLAEIKGLDDFELICFLVMKREV